MIINEWAKAFADLLSSTVFYAIPIHGAQVPLIVLWLIIAALFFTMRFRFVNFRHFKTGIQIAMNRYPAPNAPGEITYRQALTTALSGTVGIGNIGGVAIAIGIGGPGATFWLIIAGFLSMSTKFLECTLGVRYRDVHPDGTTSGGPMYYLHKGLAERGHHRLGRVLGAAYAICLVFGCFGLGNLFQANQVHQQVVSMTGGMDSLFTHYPWLFNGVMALIIASVIIGGVKSIGRVTERLVPAMAIFYITCAFIILGTNISYIPDAIMAIIRGAFMPEGVAGGVIGAIIIGFRRAVFSNEAGIGTSPTAHSASKTHYPAAQGLVAMLEPFIDTVIVCTITGLTITTCMIQSGALELDLTGVKLVSATFAQHYAWMPYPLTVAVILFGFSTIIAWSYYGLKGWTYLFGEGKHKENLFKLIFCLAVVFAGMIKLSVVVQITDALIFMMAFPNIIGLYLMTSTAKQELKSLEKALPDLGHPHKPEHGNL